MPISQQEEKLVFAAQHGNTACFEELYKLYYEKIYALAQTMLKNSADAEDALQMTFVSAWKNLERLENPAAFSTWLQRITVNQCNSMLRRRRPAASIDDESEDGEVMQIEDDLMLPEQYAERDDLSHRLQKIINDLSDVQRETVMLYYFNEMTVEEIAEIMDCSVGTVKSRLFLARKALKTEIEEQERKTGEKFYGVALIPFGAVFVGQVIRNMISKNTAMNIYQNISASLFGTPFTPQTPQSAPAQGGQPMRPAARHASSVPRRAATAAAKHGARHVAASATKAAFPLWAKIVSGVLVGALIATGGIVAYSKLAPKQDAPADNNGAVTAEGTKNTPSYLVGDTFTFGKFEQDNNAENGAEDILWRVLENTDGKIFVISEYALDSLSYENYGRGENWSDTGLRDYLNGDFYHTAFSEEEQRYIADTYLLCDEGHDREKPKTIVMDKPNPNRVIKRDSAVMDKVFLMNDFEVSRYLSSDASATATEYAIAKGVAADDKRHSAWWLRSYTTTDAICLVDRDGAVDITNGGKSGDNYALRPVMWIDLKAIEKKQDAASVVQPVDTRYLNQSLELFLTHFNYRNFRQDDNEFDSKKLDDTNILFDILTWFPCVSYSVYDEELKQEERIWKDVSKEPCPVDKINNSRSKVYVEMDADKIDDIAKRIFQCTDADIERMRDNFPETEWQVCAYSEGKYYSTRSPAEFIYDPCCYNLIDAEYRDGYYYFTLDLYQNRNHTRVEVNVGETTPDKRIYVKTKLLPHEGNPWWSLYYYSTTPSEEFNVASAEAPQEETRAESALSYADLPKEYIFAAGGGGWSTHLTLSDDGSYTGNFTDMDLGSRTIYVCDFHGTFADPVKVSDHLYTADILSMEADRPAGTEEKDGTTYHYSEDARGFMKDSQKLYIYLPDTPLSEINQKLASWLHISSDDPSEKLGFYALAIDDQYGYREIQN